MIGSNATTIYIASVPFRLYIDKQCLWLMAFSFSGKLVNRPMSLFVPGDTGFRISMTIVRLSHHKVIPRYGVTSLDMASVLLFVSTTPTYLSLNGTLDEFNNW